MRRTLAPVSAGLALLVVASRSTAPASATPRGVGPEVWAEQVCVTARPWSQRAVVTLEAMGPLRPGSVQTIDEMIGRVETLYGIVVGMIDLWSGLRQGIAAAAVPKVPHGRRVTRQMVEDLGEILDGLDELRTVAVGFLNDPTSDPQAAAARVQDAFEQHLAPEAFEGLEAHWPRRLARAMERTPECDPTTRAIRAAGAAV